jgi:hypothetical protein
MDGDPPVDLASERCGGNVAWCPPKHQESSVAFAGGTLGVISQKVSPS